MNSPEVRREQMHETNFKSPWICVHCGKAITNNMMGKACPQRNLEPPPADSILITREQLLGIEFSGRVWDGEGYVDCCPVCEGFKGGWHVQDCWLGAALGEKR